MSERFTTTTPGVKLMHWIMVWIAIWTAILAVVYIWSELRERQHDALQGQEHGTADLG